MAAIPNAASQSTVALRSQWKVIQALILRDIRTRFFGNGLGYVVAICWPLAHILVLLVLAEATGRVVPFGNSGVKFLAVALVPVMSFMYMSRFIMMSVGHNRPLLAFPIVKLMDIILARAILEVAASCCMAALLALILVVLDIPLSPQYPAEAALSFASALVLGFGVGLINSVIAMKAPAYSIVYILISIVIYMTSGAMFLPSVFPEYVQHVLSYNPVLHTVEWMREAFYFEYQSPILSKNYIIGFGISCIFIALSIERFLGRFIKR